MKDGAIVEFDAGDRHLLGVVTRELGEKYIVVTEEGDEMRPTPDEITFEFGRTTDAGADSGRLADELGDLREELDAIADEIDVGFLWEFVRDDGAVTPASLCELFFESQTPEEVAATRQRLRDDPLYFKERGEEFEPRSESQVEEMRRQIEARREEERKRSEFVETVVELLEEPDDDRRADRADAATEDPEFREFLETLQEYAMYDRGYHDRELALELMEAIEESLGRSIDGSYGAKAFRLMVGLGLWDEHENLWLHRYNLDGEPDEEAREQLEELDGGWEPESWRVDWTDRRTFSIDDAETRDIDDALSCRRREEGGWEVAIHIADPSAHVEAGDPLDRHARGRGTSVYLPTGTIPMFPERLSEELASLVEGELRPAVTVVAEFDDDLEPVDREIVASAVRVDDRLTYEEADTLLADEEGELAEALRALERITEAHRERRLDRGALAIDLPDPDLRVDRDGDDVEIECEPESRESPAHELVSECMILANTLLGKYCRNRDIPVIFRTQEAPDRPLDDEEIRSVPEGRPRQFAKLRRMKPGNLTTEPDDHAGLGVSVYTQATSPIRRYTDLICQRQIKAHLADESLPHDADEMVELLGRVESTTREAGRAQGERQRYWLLEYLRRNTGETFEATVVEHKNTDGTHAAVWIEEVAQKFNCNFRTSVPVGETAEVVVDEADPRADRVTLTQA